MSTVYGRRGDVLWVRIDTYVNYQARFLKGAREWSWQPMEMTGTTPEPAAGNQQALGQTAAESLAEGQRQRTLFIGNLSGADNMGSIQGRLWSTGVP